MTSSSLGFSIIEENNNNNKKNDNKSEAKNHLQEKRMQRNKTLKAPRKPVNDKVRSMMEVLHNNASENEELSDFNSALDCYIIIINDFKDSSEYQISLKNKARLEAKI